MSWEARAVTGVLPDEHFLLVGVFREAFVCLPAVVRQEATERVVGFNFTGWLDRRSLYILPSLTYCMRLVVGGRRNATQIADIVRDGWRLAEFTPERGISSVNLIKHPLDCANTNIVGRFSIFDVALDVVQRASQVVIGITFGRFEQ